MLKPTTPDRSSVKAIMESATMAARFEALARLWLAAMFMFVVAGIASVMNARHDAAAGAAVFVLASWTAHLFAKEKAASLKRERHPRVATQQPTDDARGIRINRDA